MNDFIEDSNAQTSEANPEMGTELEFEPASRDTDSEGSRKKRDGAANPTRSKTALRIQYEAQVQVIRRQIGGLEDLRQQLGLSARQLCQLLLVDPSAWNRWTKQGQAAPPHIWRALQWYIILNEKIPGLTPQYFLGRDPQSNKEEVLLRVNQVLDQARQQTGEILAKNQELENKVASLEAAVRANRLAAILLGLAGLILAFAFYRLLRM